MDKLVDIRCPGCGKMGQARETAMGQSATCPACGTKMILVDAPRKPVHKTRLTKAQYLARLRNNTAYPVYRGIIQMIAVLGYIWACLTVIGSVGTFGAAATGSSDVGVGVGLICLVIGCITGVFIYFLTRFSKEAALLLADLVDSTLDHCLWTEQVKGQIGEDEAKSA